MYDYDLNYSNNYWIFWDLGRWTTQKCEKTIASCCEVKYVDFNLHWTILTSRRIHRNSGPSCERNSLE